MPRRPAKGARSVFLPMVARMLSAAATATLKLASALSNSDCEMTFCASSSLARPRLAFASATEASAPGSCACSEEVSCFSRRSPSVPPNPLRRSARPCRGFPPPRSSSEPP
jgi:hypothetical protein